MTSRWSACRAASPRSRCTTRPPTLADERGVASWLLTLSAHRRHGDGRRGGAGDEAARHPGGDGRRPTARTIAAGTPGRGAHGPGRAVGGVGRPQPCAAAPTAAARVVVCGKGNNGGDGLRHGAGAARVGDAGRGASRSRPAIDRVALTRGAGARRRRRRRDVRHRVPRRARRRRGVDRRGGGGAPRRRWSRSTSRRASTGSPARSRAGRRRRPHRHVRGGQARVWCSSPAASHAGTVTVADIGIDVGAGRCAPAITEDADVAAWLPPREPSTHKWEVGGVMVVGGTTGMTGAPMFVSHAAMRAGAGIVWCGVPGDEAAAARVGHRGHHRRAPGDARRARSTPRRGAVLAPDLERFGAVVVGPGLGGDDGIAVHREPARRRRARCRSCSTPTGSTRSRRPVARCRSSHERERADGPHPPRRRVHAAGRASRPEPTGSRPPAGSRRPRPTRSCCSRDRPR